MIVEKRGFETLNTAEGRIGHITLSDVAIPETVKVTLLDEEIIPVSFDWCGHPNFTQEQQLLYNYKEEEIKRQYGDNITLKAVITYEKRRNLDVPRSSFDTLEGIRLSLRNLSDFNEMLINRKLFHRIHGIVRLEEFMVFGCFYLNNHGHVMSVAKADRKNIVFSEDVEHFEVFAQNNPSCKFIFTSAGFDVPKPNIACPCCGKIFTMDDLKNNPCVSVKGKIYHYSCYCNYIRFAEIDKFTREMMNFVYKRSDYTFELLPNRYAKEGGTHAHIPWLLFHTIDGDIIIGTREKEIIIEWQKNYKPFDIYNLFSNEIVSKWGNDNKRCIHAANEKDAFGYLMKVRRVVNLNYPDVF